MWYLHRKLMICMNAKCFEDDCKESIFYAPSHLLPTDSESSTDHRNQQKTRNDSAKLCHMQIMHITRQQMDTCCIGSHPRQNLSSSFVWNSGWTHRVDSTKLCHVDIFNCSSSYCRWSAYSANHLPSDRHLLQRKLSTASFVFGTCLGFSANTSSLQFFLFWHAGLRHVLHVRQEGFWQTGDMQSRHFLAPSSTLFWRIEDLNAVLFFRCSHILQNISAWVSMSIHSWHFLVLSL